jgi:hypothetical protein
MKSGNPFPENERNPMWKGDRVQHKALHVWLRRRIPRVDVCEICSVRKALDLANVTGVYDRNLSNYRYMCRSCHTKLDLTSGVRRPPTLEHRRRISLANSGKNHWNYGGVPWNKGLHAAK